MCFLQTLLPSHYVEILLQLALLHRLLFVFAVLHNEGPPINFGVVEHDAPSVPPPTVSANLQMDVGVGDGGGWGASPSVCHHTS